jgi:hypothetical protein
MNPVNRVLFLSFGILALLAIPARAQNVVTDWNTIASRTIVQNGGKSPAASAVWFAYAAIASYDAVNAIDPKHQPFYYSNKGSKSACKEAAALAAAHRVLVNYFPDQQAALDANFAFSLAAISADPIAKSDGLSIGEAAAAAIIAARSGDGLEANVPYTPGSGPGVWQPTPPKYSAAATPWLGQMRPFTMKSPSQFLPDGPTPLDSVQWERDYIITGALGATNGSLRTPTQTEIGLFWTEHAAQQYARAFNYLAENQKLDVADSARLMAILWTGYADAAIGCFNAKYHYSFWRPATAIPDGGGNPELTADPSWTSLGTTPNHPEYPAAHGCVTGAISDLIEDFFGTPNVRIVADSLAFSDGVHTHTLENTNDLFDEVFWARIYAGFHFQHSLEDGGVLGRRVSRQLLCQHFQRLGDGDNRRDREHDRDGEKQKPN